MLRTFQMPLVHVNIILCAQLLSPVHVGVLYLFYVYLY